MKTFDAIYARRSIRKFKSQEIDRDTVEKILRATIQAPSGKNRQPWKLFVLQAKAKDDLCELMEKSISKLKDSGINTGSSEYTVRSMKQAPVLILVFNTETRSTHRAKAGRYMNLVDVQSIGGAIQTMLLAAEDMGLGTLWICDVFYADKEICDHFKTDRQLIAAVSIGYKDESPDARPRKSLNEVVEWRE
jgi:nitroreductase